MLKKNYYNPNCPHCTGGRPHRSSRIKCLGCRRTFAKYHVPPEIDGKRLCDQCRAAVKR